MDVYRQVVVRSAFALLGVSFLIIVVLVPGIGIFGGESGRTVMYDITAYTLAFLASWPITPEWASDMMTGWIKLIPINSLIQSSEPQTWWVFNTWRVWIGLLFWLWLFVFALLAIVGFLGFCFKKTFLG